MSKYTDVFKDTQEIFDKLIITSGLNHLISIKVLANNDLKTIGETKKLNDLAQHLSKEDVVIVLNELIFEQLPEDFKLMQAEELIAPVSVDMESGKVTITKPDISTFSTILSKYGFSKYEVLKESIKTLFQIKEEKEEEAKNAKTKMKQK